MINNKLTFMGLILILFLIIAVGAIGMILQHLGDPANDNIALIFMASAAFGGALVTIAHIYAVKEEEHG